MGKFCGGCGSLLNADAKFCPGCGTSAVQGGSGGAAAAGGSGDPVMTEHDLSSLMEQLERMQGDKDRMRLLKAATSGFSFQSQQVAALMEAIVFNAALPDAAALLYGKVNDPDKFDEEVIAKFRYADQKATVREALGI